MIACKIRGSRRLLSRVSFYNTKAAGVLNFWMCFVIPGSVFNSCTCFELYKSFVFLDVFLCLKQFCCIYLAVLKFVFSPSVLRFLQVFYDFWMFLFLQEYFVISGSVLCLLNVFCDFYIFFVPMSHRTKEGSCVIKTCVGRHSRTVGRDVDRVSADMSDDMSVDISVGMSIDISADTSTDMLRLTVGGVSVDCRWYQSIVHCCFTEIAATS